MRTSFSLRRIFSIFLRTKVSRVNRAVAGPIGISPQPAASRYEAAAIMRKNPKGGSIAPVERIARQGIGQYQRVRFVLGRGHFREGGLAVCFGRTRGIGGGERGDIQLDEEG